MAALERTCLHLDVCPSVWDVWKRLSDDIIVRGAHEVSSSPAWVGRCLGRQVPG